MNRCDCIEKITQYLGQDSCHGRSLIVNVQHVDDLSEIKTHFCATQVNILPVSSLCREDFLPQLEDVTEHLKKSSGPVLLTELTTFWRFHGHDALHDILMCMLRLSAKHPLVVLAYQCEDILKEIAQQYLNLRDQICWIENRKTRLPTLVFVHAAIGDAGVLEKTVSGIHRVASELENWVVSCAPGESALCVDGGKLHVISKWRRQDLQESLYVHEWMDNVLEFMRRIDPQLAQLKDEDGTSEQWQWLFRGMSQKQSLRALVGNLLGCKPENLDAGLWQYMRWNDHEKWLYYLACRLWTPQNAYMKEALKTCVRSEKLLECLYRHLANITDIKTRLIDDEQYDDDIFWENFWKIYHDRRSCLQSIGSECRQEAMDYCVWLKCSKEKHALYYLTDLTDSERQTMLEYLEKNPSFGNRSMHEKVLETVCPRLSQYLRSCKLDSDEVEPEILKQTKLYFEQYKYDKLVNHIEDSFAELARQESIHRSYNSYPKRDAAIEKICRYPHKTEVWFVDALGVEFLNYISEKCKSLKLSIKSTLHRSNLPTLTKMNYTRALREQFEHAGIKVIDVKDIDELKHEELKDDEYTRTQLPLHLFRELESLDKLLDRISQNLRYGSSSRAIIIPDHGASRLAVLASQAEVVDAGSPGEHSGRLCPWGDGMKNLPDAVRSDDEKYYVMAGYRRFKGGRKAVVEVHGGATLEEVLIPIITLTNPNAAVEIIVNTTEIKVDYQTAAVLKFHAVKQLSVHVMIKLEGRTYEAKTSDGKQFEVHTDIRRASEYTFDVYEGDKLIANGLRFKTVSRGMQCNDEDFF